MGQEIELPELVQEKTELDQLKGRLDQLEEPMDKDHTLAEIRNIWRGVTVKNTLDVKPLLESN